MQLLIAHVPHGFRIRFSKGWNPTPPCLRIYQSSKCCQRCHPGGFGGRRRPGGTYGDIWDLIPIAFLRNVSSRNNGFWGKKYAKVCIVIVLPLCLILQLVVPTNFKTVPPGLGRWWWHWQTTDVVNNNLTSATANQWPSLKEKMQRKMSDVCAGCLGI